MSIVFSNHADDKLDVVVAYYLFRENPSKVIFDNNKEHIDEIELDDYSLYVLLNLLPPDDFKYHVWNCINLFKIDVQQYINFSDDKSFYFISGVSKENNYLMIPFISTDFVLCKITLENWKTDNEDILKEYYNFKIHSYNLNKKEIGLYLDVI